MIKCQHCGHYHPSSESVRVCGLQVMGWRWVDEDGNLANGPFTRPEGGCPVGKVELKPPYQGEISFDDR